MSKYCEANMDMVECEGCCDNCKYLQSVIDYENSDGGDWEPKEKTINVFRLKVGRKGRVTRYLLQQVKGPVRLEWLSKCNICTEQDVCGKKEYEGPSRCGDFNVIPEPCFGCYKRFGCKQIYIESVDECIRFYREE